MNNGDKMTPFDVWQEKNSKAQFQARPVGASVAIPFAAMVFISAIAYL